MSTDQQSEEIAWRRRVASITNNRAWTLAEMSERTAQQDEEMLHAAHASAHLWRSVGTARNAALADLLLGQVHSLLGNAALAQRFADSARAFFLNGAGTPSDRAMAHAVAANAAHCGGDAASHEREYTAALSAMEAIANEKEKEIVLATLRVIPPPLDRTEQG